MTSLAYFARALGGDVVGAQILCPGPGHSPKDRSLSVQLSMAAPDGFIVFSHAGDDPLVAKDFVREKLGWTRSRYADRASQAPPAARAEVEAAGSDKVDRARAVWRETVHPRGTLVEQHLASRGLVLPEEVAGSAIRFHPACAWRDEATGEVVRVPAMVAAFRNIQTNAITGVHRTALSRDGAKVGRRMLGVAAGAAIKLDADDTVTVGLTIGEGIETCLAARQIGFRPVWAMGSVGAIAGFPILSGVDGLTLLAESGDSGASARAVHECGTRWESAEREVIVASPRVGGDINDAIRGGK